MTDISDFVQQSHNFIAFVVKPQQPTDGARRFACLFVLLFIPLFVLLADGR